MNPDSFEYGQQTPTPNPGVAYYVQPKPKSRWRTCLAALGIIVLLLVVWLAGSVFFAWGKISTKNSNDSQSGLPFLSFPKIGSSSLRGESDGRVNILLLGIGGAGHPGGQLTDTMMLVSINTREKAVALLSIPRDLYVPIAGDGSNKINYAHAYGEQNSKQTGGGPAVAKKTVGQVLDLPIHYFIRVDFTGFTKFVDALGGVTVNVEKTIDDPFYPDARMEGYEPFHISAGVQKLDGKNALKYSRSRETTSDFDRAKRQQQVLLALKEKAVSLGVLGNPKKVTEIIGILGDHVKTDLQLWEVERLVTISRELDLSKTINKVIDNGPSGLLASSGGEDGGYYLVPKAGNFKDIQQLAKNIFQASTVATDKAKISFKNASSNSQATVLALDKLRGSGLTITTMIDIPEKQKTSIIYDYSGGLKPATLKLLKEKLGVRSVKSRTSTDNQIDFEVILGDDFK